MAAAMTPAPQVRYLARAWARSLLVRLGAVNTVLGLLALALVADPVLVGVVAALTALSAFSAVQELVALAPPMCWCGIRHWDEPDEDEGGNGGLPEFGTAA